LAKDGYLFVTFANHHYTDFAMSWVARLRALNATNFLVGAMDDDILSTLARRGVPTFHMQSGEMQGLGFMSFRGRRTGLGTGLRAIRSVRHNQYARKVKVGVASRGRGDVRTTTSRKR
jgi:hypothetical protein